MFARTPRLLLRPGWMEDAPALAEAINDPAILRNLTHVPSPYGMDDAERFLSQLHDPRFPRLLAFTRTQGAPRLVGGCGIHLSAEGAPELGYWVARPYWGLGFATEAARAVLAMGRAAGLRDISAKHMVDNPASGHVLRKIGFRFTGRVEKLSSLGRGEHVDCLVYEEGECGHAVNDPAMDLYGDALPAMAA